jgi:hypothetical protein
VLCKLRFKKVFGSFDGSVEGTLMAVRVAGSVWEDLRTRSFLLTGHKLEDRVGVAEIARESYNVLFAS